MVQRMRKIKPFKLLDVTKKMMPQERQSMIVNAVRRILAAESKFCGISCCKNIIIVSYM